VAVREPHHLLLRICAVMLMTAASTGCPAGQHYDKRLVGGSCTACGAGQYSAGSTEDKQPRQCTGCQDGYTSGSGQSSCSACTAGESSNRGHTACDACNPGQHSSLGTRCTDCAAGGYSNGGASSCTPCSAGQYSHGGARHCTECKTGQYSNGGTESCAACGAGQHSDSDHTGCTDCNPGQISAGGESSCHACAAGQRSSAAHTVCADCVAGQFSGFSPGESCQLCGKGKFSKVKAAQCTDCLRGQYADAEGSADHCQTCPPNSDTPGGTGSTTVTACCCKPGYNGTIKDMTPTSKCDACPMGTSKAGYTPGALCLQCAFGQYQDKEGMSACRSCGGLDGCQCANASNKLPPWGVCRNSDPCQGSPGCKQGATCAPDGPDGKAHTCDCIDTDRFGLNCERTCLRSDDHLGDSDGWCDNNGRCIYDPDTTNELGYLCSCTKGWSGAHCKKKDPCIVDHPCANSASCNVSSIPGENGYTCQCPTGFSGKNCDILTSEWGTSTSDWGLLVLGSLAVACYFGLYWQILRMLQTDKSKALRILVVTGVTMAALVIVFCIVGAVHGFGGSCDGGQSPTPTPTPQPRPMPQPTPEPEPAPAAPEPEPAPAPGAPCCSTDQRKGCNPDQLCSSLRTCDRTHGAHGSWNGTVCECDHGYSGSVCHIGPTGRQCCNTCCPQHKFTPHAVSGDGCYCWNPEPGESRKCDAGCDVPNPTRAVHLQSSVSNATPAPALVPPRAPPAQRSDCLIQVRDDDLKVYGAVLGSTLLQGTVAFGLHQWVRGWFPNFATESVSRLRRGTGLPLLVLFSAIPSIAIGGIWANPDGLSSAGVDMVVDEFVINTWRPLNFAVLFPTLSVAVVLARVYLKESQRERGDCEKFLRDSGVPHPRRFLFAEKSLAALSGLLFPFFWISYLVNEQQEFLSFARVGDGYSTRMEYPEMRYTRNNGEFASVDGVRALTPVVCALNFVAAGWGGYMIYTFPAPLVWTPWMFFGVVWCAACCVMLVVISLVLIWSLSESKELADNRYREVVFGYGMHGHILLWTFPTCYARLQEYLCCARNFCRSWTGQTLISGMNHLFAIVLFWYGLDHFHGQYILESEVTRALVPILTPAIKKYLWAGISLTVFGFVTSMASLFQRRRPKCKCTPTDDSFRLACVLKALLVMTKALIVYELSKIDMKTNEDLEGWYHLVFYVCCFSVFILAILTCAFDVFKVARNPRLIEDAGFANGTRFLKMYLFSFISCKLAIFFFVTLGHIPQWMGCGSEPLDFTGTRGMDASIDCTICYQYNKLNNTRCPTKEPFVYYQCTTTCSKLFFSGGGEMPVTLDVFVLVPLIWLPFAVYSNNEVARMIDGIWQRKRNLDQQQSGSASAASSSVHSAARVGLSSTGHGYNAIVNLSHTVVLLCCASMVYLFAKAGGSYQVKAPVGLIQKHPEIQKHLHGAGVLVTACIIALNGLMVSRFLYEKSLSCGREPQRPRGPASGLLQEPLNVLNGGGAAPPPHRHNRASQESLCMFGCGRCVAPGRRQNNGDPYDSCCRACAVAGGSPLAHDPECEHRLPRF
jgi:hypothetical protein